MKTMTALKQMEAEEEVMCKAAIAFARNPGPLYMAALGHQSSREAVRRQLCRALAAHGLIIRPSAPPNA